MTLTPAILKLSIAIHILNIMIVPAVYAKSGLTRKHLTILGATERKTDEIVQEFISQYKNLMNDNSIAMIDKLFLSVTFAALLTHFPHLDDGNAKKFMIATWKAEPNLMGILPPYKKFFEDEYEKFKRLWLRDLSAELECIGYTTWFQQNGHESECA